MYLNYTVNYDVAKIKVKSVTDRQSGAQNVCNSTIGLGSIITNVRFMLLHIVCDSN